METTRGEAHTHTYVVGNHAAAAEHRGFTYISGVSTPCHRALLRAPCAGSKTAPQQRASDVTHHALRGQYWSLASSEIPEIDDCNTIPHSLAPPRPPRAAAPWAHCPRRTWWRGVASPRALLSLARRAATVPACIDSRPAMRTSACM